MSINSEIFELFIIYVPVGEVDFLSQVFLTCFKDPLYTPPHFFRCEEISR